MSRSKKERPSRTFAQTVAPRKKHWPLTDHQKSTIDLVAKVLTVIIALVALLISLNANSIASDALVHQQQIEQNTLKVGSLVSDTNNDTMTFYLCNNKYAAYPAYFSQNVVCYINEKKYAAKIVVNTNESKNAPLLIYPGDCEGIVVHIPEQLKEKENGIYSYSLEIYYLDYMDMNVKTLKTNYDANVQNGSVRFSQNYPQE